MVPININSRRFALIDSDLPSTDRKPTPSCSPEIQNSPFVFQNIGQPKQSRIDGEVWPPIFKPEFIRSAKMMQPRKGDVFVCTYPKCGTTWIQHICSQLMTDNYGPQVGHELCVTSPMIERMGAKFADNLDSPRLLKTHFSWYNLPKSTQAKYIFVVRNPKDCLISYFHHNRNFKIYDYEHGNFSDFFELFLSDDIAFGNYFNHLKSWLPHITDENVLFLKYEEMCEDLPEAIVRIGHFIGGKAAKKIEDPTILEQIVLESTIDSMKKNQWRWFPADNLRQNNFVRKGGSRNWKNHMTREQSDRIDAEFRRQFEGTLAANWWRKEMAWELDGQESEFLLNDDDFYSQRSNNLPTNDDDVEDEGIFDINSSIKPTEPSKAITIPVPAWRKYSTAYSLSSGFGSLFSAHSSLSSSPFDKTT